MDTKAVLDHHLAAFSTGSVEETLKDYTDDSVFITRDAVLKGREVIHTAFSTMLSGLFKPGTYDFTMDAVHVEGDVAYIVWRASCATAEVALGTDTFLVRNGKIAAQTFAAKIDPK